MPGIIFIGHLPVIGTIVPSPTPTCLEAGDCVCTAVTLLLEHSDRIAAYRKQMLERQYDWRARFSYMYDHNAAEKLQERRVDGRLEVFAPCGMRVPPDGWLIEPRFDRTSKRCIGQTAYRCEGVKWADASCAMPKARAAWMQYTGLTDFIPLDVYMPAE